MAERVKALKSKLKEVTRQLNSVKRTQQIMSRATNIDFKDKNLKHIYKPVAQTVVALKENENMLLEELNVDKKHTIDTNLELPALGDLLNFDFKQFKQFNKLNDFDFKSIGNFSLSMD